MSYYSVVRWSFTTTKQNINDDPFFIRWIFSTGTRVCLTFLRDLLSEIILLVLKYQITTFCDKERVYFWSDNICDENILRLFRINQKDVTVNNLFQKFVILRQIWQSIWSVLILYRFDRVWNDGLSRSSNSSKYEIFLHSYVIRILHIGNRTIWNNI